MRDEDFQELLQAVEEAVEHYEGRRDDLRTTVLPVPPVPITAPEIRALRARTRLSQRVFAMALNVSIKTVQAWEAGTRLPDGGNLRLLRIAELHPEILFGGLSEPSRSSEGERKGRSRAA